MERYVRWIGWLIGISVSALAIASPADNPDVLDRWLNDDSEARALSVNEGELRFLPSPPDKQAHHHHNVITLDEDSLKTGWGRLGQCHEHLDPVGRLQIVYRPERIRKLRVVSAEGIGRVWVEGPSVQLEDVSREARLCIEAESRMLEKQGADRFSLRNGPFMRRFLDGFYSMHVTQEVHVPAPLVLISVTPPAAPGFTVEQTGHTVILDAWFEGILNVELRFVLTGMTSHGP